MSENSAARLTAAEGFELPMATAFMASVSAYQRAQPEEDWIRPSPIITPLFFSFELRLSRIVSCLSSSFLPLKGSDVPCRWSIHKLFIDLMVFKKGRVSIRMLGPPLDEP